MVTWAIRESVPPLNRLRRPQSWPSLAALRSYPPGSLGRETAAFLDERRLAFLPRYENHDAIHLILQYETSARGELELQAFMWGNGASSCAGRGLFLWGALMLPEHVPAMRDAFARGRRARPIQDKRLPLRLRDPLAALRREIEPNRAVASNAAVEPSQG
jgi:hypothetical protein